MNVGEIVDKISELKSRKALAQQLVTYLSSNYISSDTGAAEMRVTREDGNIVVEEHVDRFIDTLLEMSNEAASMAAEFENFSAHDPEDAIRKKVAKPKPNRKKPDDTSSSEGNDPPASINKSKGS